MEQEKAKRFGVLVFKREYVNAILSGEKRTTVRLGRLVPAKEEVVIWSGGRPVAKVKVKGVKYKKLGELTSEEAKADGFDSVEALVYALEKHYGKKLSENQPVSIVEFELVKPVKPEESIDYYIRDRYGPFTFGRR